MIKISFINLFNFFIFIFQLILQFYCMFMSVADTAKSLMFNNKTMTDFFK